MGTSRGAKKIGALVGTLAGASAIVLGGSFVGFSSAGAASSGLPSTVHIYSIQDASGLVAAVGQDDEKGITLAIKNINSSHFLGNTKLTISYGDDASTATQAAALATSAATANYPVVIGPPLSTTAVAVAPILSRAKQITLFTQAGGPGTLLSKWMFRLTPLQRTTAMPKTYKYLESKHVKTLGVIYDTTLPTLVTLYKETESDASKYGFKVTATAAVSATDTDIASAITKLISAKPDAIAVLCSAGSQNATSATELKQGGFTGPIVAEEGAGGGQLTGAGSAANGVVWTTDWNPGAPFGTASTTFTKDFTAAYGTTSSDWSAEAYTTVYFIARALKAAGTTTKTKLDAALLAEGKKGYAGVLGKDIHIKSGQMVTPGVLVQWETGKAVAMKNQNP